MRVHPSNKWSKVNKSPYSLQGLLIKIPLSAKIVIILIVVSTLIGVLGASIYAERKKTQVEEEIALELAQAGARIQKDLAETDRLNRSNRKNYLSFLRFLTSSVLSLK